jgi:serine/threonine-protein kinase ATR
MKRVERIINAAGKEKKEAPVELGNFLKTHMLGLMSHINEMLQDMQGKKSVTSKRKIIKGLGALIVQIGPNISYGAPQVCSSVNFHMLNTDR